MTEKEYKLEQWTDNSLYYSFPNGNLHHSISNVLTRVEKDLNALHEENQKLLTLSNMKKGALVEAVKDLIKENEQLKQQCKDFMEMLDDMCIAYLVNDGLEEILND